MVQLSCRVQERISQAAQRAGRLRGSKGMDGTMRLGECTLLISDTTATATLGAAKL